MSITFGRVPFPLRWGWQMICQLRIQLTWWLGKIVVVFVVPGFIPFSYLYYMIVVLGSRRYCYHDWFMWGSYALVLCPGKGWSFLAVPFCVRGMWFGVECIPWLKTATRWVVSFCVDGIDKLDFFFSSSLVSARIPHPVLMPSYWVRCSV